MRYVIIAITIYLAVAVQTALVDTIQIDRIGPHLTAMVAAAVILLRGGTQSIVIVGAIGFLEDALWPGRMGIAMAWYLLLGWGLLELRDRLDLQPLNRRVTTTGLFAALLALGVGATRYSLGEPAVGPATIAIRAAGIGLYTAALAIPFWLLLHWAETISRRRLARYEI